MIGRGHCLVLNTGIMDRSGMNVVLGIFMGSILKMIEQIEFSDRIEYQKDGLVHRTNGPARIYQRSGGWGWVLFDKRHRYYGPQNVNGVWWLYGRWFR